MVHTPVHKSVTGRAVVVAVTKDVMIVGLGELESVYIVYIEHVHSYILNFEKEVMNILETNSYELIDEEKVPVSRTGKAGRACNS